MASKAPKQQAAANDELIRQLNALGPLYNAGILTKTEANAGYVRIRNEIRVAHGLKPIMHPDGILGPDASEIVLPENVCKLILE